MAVNSTPYLGQLVPAQNNNCLTEVANKQIAEQARVGDHANAVRKIQVWVASDNALKVNAAKAAVSIWAAKIVDSPDVSAKGFRVPSDIPEQPTGEQQTQLGARNRFNYLKKAAEHESNAREHKDAVQVYVSMENGIVQEKISDLRNPQEFEDTDGKVWVDRCFVIVEVCVRNLHLESSAFSEGVTTPLKAVEAAKAENWDKTAGSFIELMYGFNAKDWHGAMAGKSREPIMKETIYAALGHQQ